MNSQCIEGSNSSENRIYRTTYLHSGSTGVLSVHSRRHRHGLPPESGPTLEVKQDAIVSVDPKGYHDEKVVGLGLLCLKDLLPRQGPNEVLVTLLTKNEELSVEKAECPVVLSDAEL